MAEAAPHGPSLVIETSGLTKRFGERTAVDHADLQVPPGVAFGFLGPNGAGKTTLIRVLLGLTAATEGEMKILGMPVPGPPRTRRWPGSARSSRSRASTDT